MPNEDLLLKIKATAQSLRDKKYEIKNIEERLSAAKDDLRTITRDTLPDLMAQAGMPRMTIEAEGNTPAFEIRVRPFARANIAASWPVDQREAAFEWLDDHGHGDLIKTCITLELPREDRSGALELLGKLRSLGYEPKIEEAVHHMTLSKWLKEMIKRGEIVPLDIIGAEVGTEATIKESDDE